MKVFVMFSALFFVAFQTVSYGAGCKGTCDGANSVPQAGGKRSCSGQGTCSPDGTVAGGECTGCAVNPSDNTKCYCPVS